MAHCTQHARGIRSYYRYALGGTSYYVDKAAEQPVAPALPVLESAMRKAEVGESGVLLYRGRGTTYHAIRAARFEDVVLYEQTRRSRCAAMDSKAYSNVRYRGVCYATT